jgi:hypothetical protein
MAMRNPNPPNPEFIVSPEDFKTEVVILRLSKKDKLRMVEKAKERGVSLSEFLRLSGLKESKPKKVKEN